MATKPSPAKQIAERIVAFIAAVNAKRGTDCVQSVTFSPPSYGQLGCATICGEAHGWPE